MDQTQILASLRSLHNWKITTKVSFLCNSSEHEKLGGGVHAPVCLLCLQSFPMQVLPWEFSRCRKSKLYTNHSDTIKKFNPSGSFHLTWIKTKNKNKNGITSKLLFFLLSEPASTCLSLHALVCPSGSLVLPTSEHIWSTCLLHIQPCENSALSRESTCSSSCGSYRSAGQIMHINHVCDWQ